MKQIEFENQMREQRFNLKKVKEHYGRLMAEEKQKMTKALSEIEIAHRLRIIELLKDEEMESRKREVQLQENLLERKREEQKTTEAYNGTISELQDQLEKEEDNVHSKIRSIYKEYEESVRNTELNREREMEMISEMKQEIDRIKLAIRFKM